MTVTEPRSLRPEGEPTSNRARWACIDGNEATALVAYAASEVIAIYPITPASPMGEAADAWSSADKPNLWGTVPEVVEMQSEAGAAGALHGAVIKGSLATTFTASQGLLLMIPNMFKIAGELTPAVIHVAARSVATHALSIFGDHSDVMATRSTGFAMLCASSVQEAHDFAAVAHAATLRARVPFVHFFDGFRTSHEINRIRLLDEDDLRALIDPAAVEAHRRRGLDPDRPVLRGSAQNPDVFFQAREASTPFHAAVPDIVEAELGRLHERTGRRYGLVDYIGAPDAERVLVIMGSGAGAAIEAVDAMIRSGERVGVLVVRLYRPFPSRALLAALPDTTRRIAVLDRTKEPGAVGEPLYQDVLVALAEAADEGARFMPQVIGGRYGLSSKEFTPAMAKAALDELDRDEPKRHFTVGIVDDVSHTSLAVDGSFDTDESDVRAVFYGLGSDGTVSANKAMVKIVGEQTGLFAQGYFVYDSKKSGSTTVSHLRFSARPIGSTYLIRRAGFVGVHQFGMLDRIDTLEVAEPGATVLLNSPHGPDDVWEQLPLEVQQQIVDKGLRLFVIDGYRVARDAGMGGRINSVMMPCFMALSGILPRDEGLAEIKRSFERTYGKRGRSVVERNNAAVDAALAELREVAVPGVATSSRRLRPPVPDDAPEFVSRVTARMLAGQGDLLPVSALPVDGTFPTGTTRYEKRQLADVIPIWDPDLCIDCAKCAVVCPHAAIRMKVFTAEGLEQVSGVPTDFLSKDFRSKDLPGHRLTIQVAPDDCTGCGVCVDVCPARSKEVARHKAIDMRPAVEHRDRERARFDAFLAIPEIDRTLLEHNTLKGSQMLEPLFEFSGACAGCGETPYLKLLTQLFGDRAIIANATGCSSIYGGNLPTTPWTSNHEGRGPAWANSLFEDNAEFGLGIRLAADQQAELARRLLRRVAPAVGDDLTTAILDADQTDEAGIVAQRERVAELVARLREIELSADVAFGADAAALQAVSGELVRRSVWIVGGDGWAYDIGFSGLDHLLASGRDVNVLVLDTEVYSNTGGQASKATRAVRSPSSPPEGSRRPRRTSA